MRAAIKLPPPSGEGLREARDEHIDRSINPPPLLPRPAAAAAGGLASASHIPVRRRVGAQRRRARRRSTPGSSIKPDDTVVIRIARSEMGQGTLTGLAQLVAEELECDWARVTTEYPTPGQNLARNRVWGDFSTGGSRGIRESQDYVRKGGATARVMLVQAAADEWKVPATECTVANGVITHSARAARTTYGKVAAAAAKLDAADRGGAEGPEELEDRRQAGQAARHAPTR